MTVLFRPRPSCEKGSGDFHVLFGSADSACIENVLFVQEANSHISKPVDSLCRDGTH